MAQTAGSNKFEKWELPETMATLVTKQNANLEKIDTALKAVEDRVESTETIVTNHNANLERIDSALAVQEDKGTHYRVNLNNGTYTQAGSAISNDLTLPAGNYLIIFQHYLLASGSANILVNGSVDLTSVITPDSRQSISFQNLKNASNVIRAVTATNNSTVISNGDRGILLAIKLK